MTGPTIKYLFSVNQLNVFGTFPVICCLLVCHGGSLQVPEQLIWAWAWHGRWVGSWHGHVGPNSGLSKTHRFNPDYSHHFSLSLSLFPSIDLPSSLPPFPPTHLLSPAALSPVRASLLCHNLIPKNWCPTLAGLFPCCHFFLFVPLICFEWSLRVDFRKSIFNVWAPIYVTLDRLMCCQGNCHSYYHHGEPCIQSSIFF